MGNRNTKSSVSHGKLRKFFFIGPDCDATIDALGDALISIDSVDEVRVEDHILGYVARVKFSSDKPLLQASHLTRRLGDRFGLIRDE